MSRLKANYKKGNQKNKRIESTKIKLSMSLEIWLKPMTLMFNAPLRLSLSMLQ